MWSAWAYCADCAPRAAKRSYREMQAVCLALGDEEVVAQIREAADAAVGIDGSAE